MTAGLRVAVAVAVATGRKLQQAGKSSDYCLASRVMKRDSNRS